MLWIALHLPLLSLESFIAGMPRTAATEGGDPATDASPFTLNTATDAPVALMDMHRILHANAAAQALGVRAGQKRATALALAPQLILGEAHAGRDGRAMQAVVHVALGFTPSVTLEPNGDPTAASHTVQLEVQASLRYFGGLPKLLKRLHAALRPLGHRVHCGSAPTAQGASLLARHHRPTEGRHAADMPALTRMLDSAPVWLIGPGREHWEALQGMGLRELSDLRCLPRAHLARRFGEAVLAELDRAYGRVPDPREWLTLPPVFESRLELFARADTTEQVMNGAALLMPRLLAWLQAQQAQAKRFTLWMQHESRHRHDVSTPPDSTLEVALTEPSADATHLLSLLRERLARVQLVAPTLELRLHCADIVHRAPPNAELFPAPASEREGLTRLIERLQARLGSEQVQRLVLVEDHRPERATCAVALDAPLPVTTARAEALAAGLREAAAFDDDDEDVPPRMTRPVWLMTQPQRLACRDALPLLEGRPLDLLSGPERIEAGWWDLGLVTRDYFIAQTRQGALVWLFRERLPPAQGEAEWFLQGRFG